MRVSDLDSVGDSDSEQVDGVISAEESMVIGWMDGWYGF